ncbi:hypothetical protein SAMN05421630_102488 [Prauserella marina]|uniref:Uncharacterized protein n=1 Tax=Prauserella marina TaxID=530584 RepID=A0A1G6MEC5_9PSEU|nr:hypothetical protein DES30_1011503 [Prauserella marina]SDC53922.1 hypothetical protein SAMN05421630_102488 [Prauserella marina]
MFPKKTLPFPVVPALALVSRSGTTPPTVSISGTKADEPAAPSVTIDDAGATGRSATAAPTGSSLMPTGTTENR